MARNGVGIVCLLFGAWCGEAMGVITIRCEPNNSTPTGNDVVLFDCKLETDSAITLNSYRITLPCNAAPSGGSTGTVDHFRINATGCTFLGPDPDCLFDGYQATCINSQICFSPVDCGGAACLPDPNNPGVSYCEDGGVCQDPSPFLQTNRPDYVFGGQSGVSTNVSTGNCPGTPPSVSASMGPGTGVSLDETSGQKYIGSFRYRVSNCAGGLFTVVLQGNGNPPQTSDASFVANSAGQAVLISPVGSAVTISRGLCCNGLSCLGDHNAFCCLNVQGGTYSDVTKACSGPNPAPCICTQNSHCNDNSVCTNDSCDPGSGQANANGCILAPNYPAGNCCNPTNGQLDPLNDGNPCTLDYCQNGTYPAVHDGPGANGTPCQDDGNTCTFDYCENGSCTHPNKPYGTPCSTDGIYCTWDVCDFGACTHPDINSMGCGTIDDCPPLAQTCTSGFCTCVQPPPCWGDIVPPGGDGRCDLSDLLCCLAGYQNYASCPEADIAPCGGDAIVEVGDVLEFLAGYAGGSNCGVLPCNP